MTNFKANVERAIQELQAGKMIILVDHPDRENEGDLIFPAELTTPEKINFMLRYCSGIICVSLTSERIKKLGLDYMVAPHRNLSGRGTPFITTIEARVGITTGVSAYDRAQTILAATHNDAVATDIVTPGHVFPLQANDGGVLVRAGHTEGTVDMAKLAGFKPAGVLCELMNLDGSMMKGKEIDDFAKEHQLFVLSIDDIIQYRRLTEDFVLEEVSANLPLEHLGEFEMSVIKEKYSDIEHIILRKHKASMKHPYLVRVHSSCATSEIFGSLRCDCKKQLQYALDMIAEEGGTLVYLQQEGRGIGLFNKIKSYALQDQGMDTVDANLHLNLPIDSRKYYLAANVLRNKHIKHIRLLTNNPAKVAEMQMYGIERVDQVVMPVFCTSFNKNYLTTKRDKMSHSIDQLALV